MLDNCIPALQRILCNKKDTASKYNLCWGCAVVLNGGVVHKWHFTNFQRILSVSLVWHVFIRLHQLIKVTGVHCNFNTSIYRTKPPDLEIIATVHLLRKKKGSSIFQNSVAFESFLHIEKNININIFHILSAYLQFFFFRNDYLLIHYMTMKTPSDYLTKWTIVQNLPKNVPLNNNRC